MAMRIRYYQSYSIFAARRYRAQAPTLYPMSSIIFPSALSKTSQERATTVLATSNGDLNNVSAIRPVAEIGIDAAFVCRSLAIQQSEDNDEIRDQYRPFLLPQETVESDWIANLEISTAMKMAYEEMHRVDGGRLKVLVLYGSLRERRVCDSKSISIASL